MRTSSFAIALALAGQAGADELEKVTQYDWDTELIVGLSGLEVSTLSLIHI